jgi:hypothetical protein
MGWTRSLPLAIFILTEICIWFVTTFVVLCPLVAPGLFVMRSQPLGFNPSRAERALGWLLLIVYQLLLLLASISVARTVLTHPGLASPAARPPPWPASDSAVLPRRRDPLVAALGRPQRPPLVLQPATGARPALAHVLPRLRSVGAHPPAPCRAQALERKGDGTPRFCRKTFAYKPDRAHYCREAGSCVLQYQEFSWLLNTPIGFHNYKFYLARACRARSLSRRMVRAHPRRAARSCRSCTACWSLRGSPPPSCPSC